MRRVEIVMPAPHAGQMRIARDRTRHRILRCGRRYGKTTFGVIETIGIPHLGIEGVLATPRYSVGWFTPEYKYMVEAWRMLRSICAPLASKINDSEHRIECINGSTIDLWSLHASPDAGRGRKYYKIIVDEAGLVSGLRRWWDAAAEPTLIDYRGRALLLGTPNPVGPDFDAIFDDAEARSLPEWAAHTAATFDNDHLPADEMRKVRAKRTRMPEWLWRQEYMAIPCDAAAGFFARSMIRELRSRSLEPVWRGAIDIDDHDGRRDALITRGDVSRIVFREDAERGVWSLWIDPDAGRTRPDQERGYVMGMDVGAGVGASNTTIAVVDVESGDMIAEYASPLVGAHEAARIAAIAGAWFGGRFGRAILCPEVNGGQGEACVKTLLDLGYPRIWQRRVASTEMARRDQHAADSAGLGWRSNQRTREALLTDYAGALRSGRMRVHSDASLAECLTYHYDRRGRLVSVRRDDDPASELARIPHGDRVMAAALAWHAASNLPHATLPPQPESDHTARKRARQRAMRPGYASARRSG